MLDSPGFSPEGKMPKQLAKVLCKSWSQDDIPVDARRMESSS